MFSLAGCSLPSRVEFWLYLCFVHHSMTKRKGPQTHLLACWEHHGS